MRDLGLREVVGLAALAVALVIGFLFLDPTASESRNETAGQIQRGETVVSIPPPAETTAATAQPTVAATPLLAATPTPPAKRAASPSSWQVQFYEVAKTGGELLNGGGFVPTLDLTFATAPFPDFHDDAWFVRASADFQVAEGRTEITIVHDGDLRVFVDEKEVAHEEDGPSARGRSIVFEHAAGTAQVMIECRDVGGPFRLQFVAN
jgi:hypothetical protein